MSVLLPHTDDCSFINLITGEECAPIRRLGEHDDNIGAPRSLIRLPVNEAHSQRERMEAVNTQRYVAGDTLIVNICL